MARQPFILIDHHQQPDSFPEIAFSDTSACSTAEMVYDFIQSLGEQDHLDATVGTCIYTGIMTDSGSFRFPSVSAHTHMIVADLIERGVSHAFIHNQVYDANLLSRLKLVGYALSERLEMLNKRTAIISLDAATLKRFNYQPGDTEGLVNQALSLKDVNLAIFVREGANEIKLSFRSKGKFDVNTFARKYFHGGGHSNAAGGSSGSSFDAVLTKLRQTLNNLEHELDY
jgi:phosphoesterase RecJ-like protein